jgi:RPA family protein
MSQEYQRNPAVRMLAAELNKSDYHFQETDDERAPKFLLLPSGGKANRVMMGGTVLSVEDASSGDGTPFWKAEVEDPSGRFMMFAGQYQPEAASVLQMIANSDDKPPAFVHVVGKTKEYRPEDDESEVIVNIRPENVAIVDQQQKRNWLYETAESTINRLEQTEGEYVRMAEDRYGSRAQLLREDVQSTLESLE